MFFPLPNIVIGTYSVLKKIAIELKFQSDTDEITIKALIFGEGAL